MKIEEIENYLFGNYQDYKCNDFTKGLLRNNEEFKSVVERGIKEGKIKPFSEELWDNIRNLNIRASTNLEDAFKMGFTLGACTVASKYLSFTFKTCEIAGGTNKYLIGSKNSMDGSHTWTINKNLIYDTTFVMVIDSSYASKFGYVMENSYNPNNDLVYSNAKEFANDKSLRSSKSR